METNSRQHKINSILNELVYGSFLAEDGYARDYCKYCLTEYGNYYKRGFDKQSTQVNHEPDCLHRLAVEVLEGVDVVVARFEPDLSQVAVQETRYREPTMHDIGKAVEFRDYDHQIWHKNKLHQLVGTDEVSYLNGYRFRSLTHPFAWKQARIRIGDDE